MAAGHVTGAAGTGLHVPFPAVAPLATFIVGVIAGLGVLGAAGLLDRADTATVQLVPGAIYEPVPGEFRLGPGNMEPPGVVVSLPEIWNYEPAYREFRLGPGNMEPPGYADSLEAVDLPVPGEFHLCPGNAQPPECAVDAEA